MKLSYMSYALKCALGAEIMYLSCLAYGAYFLSGTKASLHHTMIELLPGFTWINPTSILIGALVIFAYAFIIGLYIVWMFNSSFRK